MVELVSDKIINANLFIISIYKATEMMKNLKSCVALAKCKKWYSTR